jgi:hypothetical protein
MHLVHARVCRRRLVALTLDLAMQAATSGSVLPFDPQDRLFVIFTGAEAAAVVSFGTTGIRTAAALQALAKLRTALGLPEGD